MLLLLLNGCSLFHRKHTIRAASAETAPRMVGTVAVVNEDAHFVLVDVGTLYTPMPGAALRCFADGQESAVLAVTPERKRPFIAADIVKGTPHPGDLVYE